MKSLHYYYYYYDNNENTNYIVMITIILQLTYDLSSKYHNVKFVYLAVFSIGIFGKSSVDMSNDFDIEIVQPSSFDSRTIFSTGETNPGPTLVSLRTKKYFCLFVKYIYPCLQDINHLLLEICICISI